MNTRCVVTEWAPGARQARTVAAPPPLDYQSTVECVWSRGCLSRQKQPVTSARAACDAACGSARPQQPRGRPAYRHYPHAAAPRSMHAAIPRARIGACPPTTLGIRTTPAVARSVSSWSVLQTKAPFTSPARMFCVARTSAVAAPPRSAAHAQASSIHPGVLFTWPLLQQHRTASFHKSATLRWGPQRRHARAGQGARGTAIQRPRQPSRRIAAAPSYTRDQGQSRREMHTAWLGSAQGGR
jgi:hypothetical protein